MKATYTKGGRYKVAPYSTTHVRIPERLKGYVMRISDGYKRSIEDRKVPEFTERLNQSLDLIFDDKPVNGNQIEDLARQVVHLRKQKKSTKDALDNLLTAILGENHEN